MKNVVLADRTELIEKALEIIENKNVLINLLARRVRQLNKNAHPFVPRLDQDDNISIALREVIEKKIYPIYRDKNDDK